MRVIRKEKRKQKSKELLKNIVREFNDPYLEEQHYERKSEEGRINFNL